MSLTTRVRLIATIQQGLTENEKEFLLSIKLGEPRWELMAMAHIDKLPALNWKVQNIQKMSADKRQQAYANLQNVF